MPLQSHVRDDAANALHPVVSVAVSNSWLLLLCQLIDLEVKFCVWSLNVLNLKDLWRSLSLCAGTNITQFHRKSSYESLLLVALTLQQARSNRIVVNRRLYVSSATSSFHSRVSTFTVLKLYGCEDSIDILLALLTHLAQGIQQRSSHSDTARELADVIALSHDQINGAEVLSYALGWKNIAVSPTPNWEYLILLLSSSSSFLTDESAYCWWDEHLKSSESGLFAVY